MTMSRPSWDDVFLEMARVIASRSACFKKHVGAVIVRDGKYVVSMGYNGAPQHQRNCQEIGFCFRERNDLHGLENLERCRAIGSHAESNAIAIAARLGQRTEDTTIYVVGHDTICVQCRAQIANAGISKVVHELSDGSRRVYIPSRDWIVHEVDKPTETKRGVERD